MTFWQNYGGIFTGLGILGTFAGLTSGLQDIDMTSGDIETLKNGIAKLLSGVESAFVTSLVGIGAALIYGGIHYWLLKNFRGNVQRLTEKLDEKFPRHSAEDFLADIKAEYQNQMAELKSIGTDIKNIGEQVAEAIHNALDEKLSEYVQHICAAIDKLGQGAAKDLNDKISKVAGAQMDRFSQALDRFSDSIDKKLETANEISKIMNEQMLNTLKDFRFTH